MSNHQAMALELQKRRRLQVQLTKKQRALATAEATPRTPAGRIAHLREQVEDLNKRIGNGG